VVQDGTDPSRTSTSGKEEFPFATFSFFSALFLPYLEMPLANFCKLFLPNSQKVAKVCKSLQKFAKGISK
jgi:hypothetical protein